MSVRDRSDQRQVSLELLMAQWAAGSLEGAEDDQVVAASSRRRIDHLIQYGII